MKKILAITDIHFNLSNLRKILETVRDADLILIAGDITNFGKGSEAREVIKLFKAQNKPFFFVPGNCDYYNFFPQDVLQHDIHGKHVMVDDIAIIGIGGSIPTPFSTPFELSEEQLEKMLNEVFSSITGNVRRVILLSHTPPYNTLVDLTKTGFHVGSRNVRKFIETRKVDLVICGHVHEARNIDRIGNTLIVNPGPANVGNYAIIFLNEKIEIKLEQVK